MVEEFNNRLMEEYKSMIEVCFEYTNFNEEEVDEIYILGTMEVILSINYIFRINGKITEAHKTNDYLEKKCNVSRERQRETLDFLIEDLQKMLKIFEEFEQERPLGLEIIYNVKEKKMNTSFSYESYNGLDRYYVYMNWHQKISGQQISD